MPSLFLGKHMPGKKLGVLLGRKRLGINTGRQLGVCDEVQDKSLILVTGCQLARDLGVLSSLLTLISHLQNGTAGPTWPLLQISDSV